MSAPASENILLTGVSGFLGRHILWDLLRRDPESKVYCLLRPEPTRDADQRLQQILATEGQPLPASIRARCRAVSGDIADPQVLREPVLRERLLSEVDRIIHCAATVKFDTPLGEARRINVEGTRHVLTFADDVYARGGLRRVDYFSTAFVAGAADGVVREDRLQASRFNNTYEHTKFEAEQIVRQAQSRLPITIYRPSVIVGDSHTGYTPNFRVLYWPLKVLASGLVIVVPADRQGIVDVVSVDYVVRAFEALSRSEASIGRCYHLAAGPERQSSCGELLELASEFFGVRTDLSRAGIEPAPVGQYFRNIMQFCIDSDWGRKPQRACVPDVVR